MKRYIKSNVDLSNVTQTMKSIKRYIEKHYIKPFPYAKFAINDSLAPWQEGREIVHSVSSTRDDETVDEYYCNCYLWSNPDNFDALKFQLGIVEGQIIYYSTTIINPLDEDLDFLSIKKGSPIINMGPVAPSIESIPTIDINTLEDIVNKMQELRDPSKMLSYSDSDSEVYIDEDVLDFGVDSYLDFLSERYEDEYREDPKLRVVTIVPYDGDNHEYTYKITFRDKYRHRYTDYISFLNTGDGNWTWDNNVVDRSDWMNEIYDNWIDYLKSRGYM